MKIKNYMEDVVFHAHYVVSEKGEAYSKVLNLSVQFGADVTKAFVDATEIVSKNPRH